MKDPKKLILLLSVLGLALVGLGAFYVREWYLASRPTLTPTPFVAYSPAPFPSSATTPKPTPLAIISKLADWKVFSSNELNISFRYPTEFKKAELNINPGDTGKIAYGTLQTCLDFYGCGLVMSFGGITSNFTAARESAVYESLRFMKKDGKYYVIGMDGKARLVSPRSVVVTNSGEEGLLFQGDGYQGPGGEPVTSRWLVFNLKSSDFQAVTFYNPSIEILSEEDFITIFKTLEIK